MTRTADHNVGDASFQPVGWVTAKLPELALLNPGLDRCFLDESTEVGFVPMAAVDVGFGGIKRLEIRPYSKVKKGYTPFIHGDVILAKITPCMENGKGGVVDGPVDSVYFGSTEFHVFRPRYEVNADWIARFLSQEQFRRAARLKMKGSAGQLRVPVDFLESVEIPLPPTAEQSRITDRIDELFTDLDAGIAALTRVKNKLPRYRAALLHAAVTGRLTESWRKHQGPAREPGPKLLERILAERRRQWEQRTLTKYERLGEKLPGNWRDRYPLPVSPTPPADASPLHSLPRGWCWASVDQLLREPLRNGHSAKQSGNGKGIRTLSLTAVTYGQFNEANIKITVADPEYVKDLWLEPGDLLIERANTPELVGTTRLFNGPSRFAVFPDLVIRARLQEMLNVDFVELAIRSPMIHRYFQRAAQGTAGSMPKIDQPTIQNATIPLPSMGEQTAIVETVSEKLSQIDALDAEVERGLRRSSRLRQSILKSAFEGRLVPQDPSDEPASVLLARIRQQAASESSNKAKKKPTRKQSTSSAKNNSRAALLSTPKPMPAKKKRSQQTKSKAKR